ncbi:MAG: hypothetical protein AAGI66_06445 [Cyanobacteria bacterium P01_H01_bin.74]
MQITPARFQSQYAAASPQLSGLQEMIRQNIQDSFRLMGAAEQMQANGNYNQNSQNRFNRLV